MSELILACGIQKAYLHPEGSKYMGEQADIIDTRLKSYLKTSLNPDTIVYIVREVHQPDDSFFVGEKTQSIVGTADVQIPEFYKSYSKLFINSIRYNALYRTPLESEIYKIKPERILLVGFETHSMILFTAEELRNRNYPVYIIEALVASRDEYLHAAGITLMRNFLSVEIN
jgi:nicotinamidase-related amidase